MHANGFFKIDDATWDADEVDAGWKFIDGDEWDNFSCLSDDEESWS